MAATQFYPIWWNRPALVTGQESICFSVLVDGATVFTGKAVRRPGDSYNGQPVIRIDAQDIVADYLYQNAPPVVSGQAPAHVAAEVRILWGATAEDLQDDPQEASRYYIVNDWSVDRSRTYYGDNVLLSLSAQIRNEYDPRMPIVLTVLCPGSAGYYSGSIYIARNGTAVYDEQVVQDYAVNIGYDPLLTHQQAGDVITVRDNTNKLDLSYRFAEKCGRYALYYINAFGGWDALLCKGVYTERETYERQTTGVRERLTGISTTGRQKENYLNEALRSITLRTGILTDDEASRMWHLLGSTWVYLFDMLDGNFYPVVITNSECVFKTYKNQNRKLVEYAIDIDIAQNFIRR